MYLVSRGFWCWKTSHHTNHLTFGRNSGFPLEEGRSPWCANFSLLSSTANDVSTTTYSVSFPRDSQIWLMIPWHSTLNSNTKCNLISKLKTPLFRFQSDTTGSVYLCAIQFSNSQPGLLFTAAFHIASFGKTNLFPKNHKLTRWGNIYCWCSKIYIVAFEKRPKRALWNW